MGSVPEEIEIESTTPQSSTAPPETGAHKPSFTYSPPPPPPPLSYTETPTTPNEPPCLPPPPPCHGTTYVVLIPYLSHEIGHLSLAPFDTLVDVTAHTPSHSDLPYPTAFDSTHTETHYWQASLGHRRGPRGLFPSGVVCPAPDASITQKITENWFAETRVGFIADGRGGCWVGPGWAWTEPVRRRSKWWAGEF